MIHGVLRATAAAVALAAIVDPALRLPRRERPAVRVVAGDDDRASRLRRGLETAGFRIDPAEREAATILATDRVPAVTPPSTWILDTSIAAPDVRIAEATAGPRRLPGQAVAVHIAIEAAGTAQQTSDVVIEDADIPVASARHQWTTAAERWETVLHYLPPTTAVGRLRVRVGAIAGESSTANNVADVAVPPARGPLRTLVIEAGVTWPALFVRRALEGEGAFAVSAVQRASKSVATTTGAPPRTLTRESLELYEAAIVGGPDQLSAADLQALRWFVEARGGLVAFVPDQRSSGGYLSLAGIAGLEARTFDAPVALPGRLFAAEVIYPERLPAGATPIAADRDGHAVVFAARRGAGVVVFSGALDAWRQRARDESAFAAFWRRVIAAHALTVPPALEVAAVPAIARPGERVRVTARLRAIDMPAANGPVRIDGIEARVVRPAPSLDEPIRLWPTAEPGVFAGDWRAASPGTFDVSVTAADRRGDARLIVAADVVHASPIASADLALAARAAGGRAFPAARADDLIAALQDAYPPRTVRRLAFPMRSPWWCVPFAALVCAEWALRRKRGLP